MNPPPHRRIRVLIVEDHQLVAEGLAALLEEYEDVRLLGWVPTVAAAVQRAEREVIDVALIDFRLPDGVGADAATGILQRRPATAIVFLSADDSDDAIAAAVESGAVGYLVKSAPIEDVVQALRRAVEGETLIPAQKLAELMARRRAMRQEQAAQAAATESLTPREREILELITQGMDNRAVAERLHIEYSTVRSHVRKVLLKMGARSKLEAVVKATECGITP